MQYAVQIDGIWRDLFQRLEKARDAMSSTNVQWMVRCHRSSFEPKLVQSHDKEMARDSTASEERMNAGLKLELWLMC